MESVSLILRSHRITPCSVLSSWMDAALQRPVSRRAAQPNRGPWFARWPPTGAPCPNKKQGAEEGSFSLGDSLEKGVPGREGSKGERPWRGQSSVRRLFRTVSDPNNEACRETEAEITSRWSSRNQARKKCLGPSGNDLLEPQGARGGGAPAIKTSNSLVRVLVQLRMQIYFLERAASMDLRNTSSAVLAAAP